jgi:hypothetical protein
MLHVSDEVNAIYLIYDLVTTVKLEAQTGIFWTGLLAELIDQFLVVFFGGI